MQVSAEGDGTGSVHSLYWQVIDAVLHPHALPVPSVVYLHKPSGKE